MNRSTAEVQVSCYSAVCTIKFATVPCAVTQSTGSTTILRDAMLVSVVRLSRNPQAHSRVEHTTRTIQARHAFCCSSPSTGLMPLSAALALGPCKLYTVANAVARYHCSALLSLPHDDASKSKLLLPAVSSTISRSCRESVSRSSHISCSS